jgi:hypothetical protein
VISESRSIDRSTRSLQGRQACARDSMGRLPPPATRGERFDLLFPTRTSLACWERQEGGDEGGTTSGPSMLTACRSC